MALLIYRLVIFLNVYDFVDLVAISLFWTVKVKDEYNVLALLANIYHTFHLRHEKKEGLMLCCVSLLYRLFTSHGFKNVFMIKEMNECDWFKCLVSLIKKSILWYPQKLNGGEITFSYGNFPNVSLVCSKGCINYNLILALRQLRYPMLNKPDDEMLKGFVLRDMGVEDPPML